MRYNAGYMDYKIAEMYRLNDVQRRTQITRGISNNIVRRLNDKNSWHLFDNKAEFNALFPEQGGEGMDGDPPRYVSPNTGILSVR